MHWGRDQSEQSQAKSVIRAPFYLFYQGDKLRLCLSSLLRVTGPTGAQGTGLAHPGPTAASGDGENSCWDVEQRHK